MERFFRWLVLEAEYILPMDNGFLGFEAQNRRRNPKAQAGSLFAECSAALEKSEIWSPNFSSVRGSATISYRECARQQILWKVVW